GAAEATDGREHVFEIGLAPDRTIDEGGESMLMAGPPAARRGHKRVVAVEVQAGHATIQGASRGRRESPGFARGWGEVRRLMSSAAAMADGVQLRRGGEGDPAPAELLDHIDAGAPTSTPVPCRGYLPNGHHADDEDAVAHSGVVAPTDFDLREAHRS